MTSYNRQAYLARRARGLTADDPRHGTTTGYNAYACRCDLCRKANRDYIRKHRGSALAAADAIDKSARMRALIRLAEIHPEDFQRLMARDVAE